MAEETGPYTCFHCGENMVIWDNDFGFDDYGYEGEGVVHELHCAACGARITYEIPEHEGDADELR